MNLSVSKANTHLDFLRSAAELGCANAQNYKIALSKILPYTDLKNHLHLDKPFKLDVTPDAFLSNAKAYGFEFDGISCAYVMTQVLNSNNHSLWLAIEIHQYKDSWGLDAGEISWLYLKNEKTEKFVDVVDMRLFPLKLFTDYEEVEKVKAIESVTEDFIDDLPLIASHSRMILDKFSPNESMGWLRDLSTLGYALTQFSPVKVQHTQTKIDIRNAFTPYLLEIEGVKHKAISLLQRMEGSGVVDSFWLSFLFDNTNSINLDKVIVSFGQYAAELTVCKAPSHLLIEHSAIFDIENFSNGDFDKWLKSFGIPSDKQEDYRKVVQGALNYYFDKAFIERIMFRCDFGEDAVSSESLGFESQAELKAVVAQVKGSEFTVNSPLYFSSSSFPSLNYQPDEKYSLVEDYIQPSTLKPIEDEEVVDYNSEFDHHQPDFNEEDRISKLFAKNSPKPYERSHSVGHGYRERSPKSNSHFGKSRGNDDVDAAIETRENTRKSKHDRQPPAVKSKYRFRGLLNQANKKEHEAVIQETQRNLKEDGSVANFIDQVSYIPENAQDIHDVTAEQINEKVQKQKAEKEAKLENTQTVKHDDQGDVSKIDVVKATEKPKRSRGRPPKEKKLLQDTAQEVSAADEVEKPKRGRGRPPKEKELLQDTVQEASAIEVVEKPKRGRGRPPKSETAAKEQESLLNAAKSDEFPVEEAKQVVEAVQEPIHKKVASEPVEVAQESVQQEPSKVISLDNFEIIVSDSIVFKDNTYGVSANYPKHLIIDNPNYLFNSLVGYGVDKFKVTDALIEIGCNFAEYKYHDLQRKLEEATEIQLAKYDGFEKYISECEYEIYVRR